MFSPRTRDLALTAHVVSSVGWLGAVLVFLVIAISGLTAEDHVARASYASMQIVAWRVIVPLCFASFATGIVQSLGTKWGLFRHYWVVIKLVITVIATGFLLLHTRPIDELAHLASTSGLHHANRLRVQLVLDSAAALAALVVATVLAVYKPRGLTRYGRAEQHA